MARFSRLFYCLFWVALPKALRPSRCLWSPPIALKNVFTAVAMVCDGFNKADRDEIG